MQAVWLLIIADIYIYAKFDLDDPVVRKKIIAQVTEVTVEKKLDDPSVFYELPARSPYKGTGWVVIYGDVRIRALLHLKDGKQEGLLIEWHDNGQKKYEVNFKDDKLDGLTTSWDEHGLKSGEANYKDGKLIED